MPRQRGASSLLFCVLFLVFSTPVNATAVTNQAHSKVGVIIPFYVPSTSSGWNKIIAEKKAFANVSFVVIVNPDSGVGPSKDPNFAKDVKEMQDAGITVLGYDWTGYGSVPQKDVEGNMSDYAKWYGVNGIFFDGMSASASKVSYYETDSSYARALKFSITVGNPGTNVNSKLYNIFKFLNVWENHNLPSTSNLNTGESASQQSYIANGIKSFPPPSKLDALNDFVSFVFITSYVNYGQLPSYFNSEINYLSHT